MTTSQTRQASRTSQARHPAPNAGTTLAITARAFRDLVRPVLPHAASSAELPILNAVHLYTHAGHVIAEATDRYTLGISRAETTSPAGFDAVLSLSAVHRILAMFKPSRTANATLTFTTSPTPSASDGYHGCETVTVTGDAVLGMAGATLRFDHAGRHFPALRKVVAAVIDGAPQPAGPGPDLGQDTTGPDVHGYTAAYMARFATATRKREPMVCHRTRSGVLVVTVGAGFIGAIMAARLTAEAPQSARSWAAILPTRTSADNATDAPAERQAGVAA